MQQLLFIDFHHQFRWCQDFHLGKGKPFLAQVLNGCTDMVHDIINTQESVVCLRNTLTLIGGYWLLCLLISRCNC